MAKEFIVSTGRVIKNYLDEYGITQKELAKRTGISEKHISHVLKGHSELTVDMALKLEKILTGVPASYWLNYEAKYREQVARENSPAYSASPDIKKSWADRFHFKEVFKDMPLSLNEKIDEMLSILQISSFDSFDTVYSTSAVAFMEDGGEKEAIAIWLGLCREDCDIQNDSVAGSFDRKLFLKELPELRTYIMESDMKEALRKVRAFLNRHGVYLVVRPAIRNCKVRGALVTYKKQPAIYMSLRFKTHDHIWFALLHEIGHLVKHYDGKEESITLDGESTCMNEKEQEANTFAQNFLVAPGDWTAFITQGLFSNTKILPGIIVARLQHEGIMPHEKGNELKLTIGESLC